MTFRAVKPWIAVSAILYFGISIVLLSIIMWLADASWYLMMPIKIFFLCGFCIFVHHCFVKRITISTQGVEYKSLTKNYSLHWEDIKAIGTGYYMIRSINRPRLIYFTKNLLPSPIITDKEFRSNDYIVVHYRKRIEMEILKYWARGIHGTEWYLPTTLN